MVGSSKIKDLPPQHQVFINFYGDNSNAVFIGKVIPVLRDNNINVVYFDNNEDRKKPLKAVLKRIEKSSIALVFLSKYYTESTRCLKELKKIKDCVEKNELVAIPILYKLQPSFWRAMWFGDAFRYLVEGEARKKRDWENALLWIQNIIGLKVHEESPEDDIIGEIVKAVKKMLKEIPSEESQKASVDVFDRQSSSGDESNSGEIGMNGEVGSSFVSTVEEQSLQQYGEMGIIGEVGSSSPSTVGEQSLQHLGEMSIIGEVGSFSDSTVQEQSLQHLGEMSIIGEVGSFSAPTVEEQLPQHCGEICIIGEVGSFSAPTVGEQSLQHRGEMGIIAEVGSFSASTVGEQSLQHSVEMGIIGGVGSFSASTVEEQSPQHINGEVGSSSASTIVEQSLQHSGEMGIIGGVGSFSVSTVEEQSPQHCGEICINGEVGSSFTSIVEEQSLQHRREMGIIGEVRSLSMTRSSRWISGIKGSITMSMISFEGDIKNNVKKVEEMVNNIPSEGSQKAFVDLSESQTLSVGKEDNTFGTKQSLKELEEKLDLNKCEGIIGEAGYPSASTVKERSLQHGGADLRHLVNAMESCTFRSQFGMKIGCLLLLFFVLPQIAYMTIGLIYQSGAIEEKLDLNKYEGTRIIEEAGYSCASTVEEQSLQHRGEGLRYGFANHLVKAMESYIFRSQLGMKIGYVLLFFFVLQHIAYMTIGLIYQGGAMGGTVGNVQKLQRNIPTEGTKNPIDKDIELHIGEGGAKHGSSISDAKTKAVFVDRTFTNSLVDKKDKPPQIQVFINFHGQQLRNSFVGYLVDALRRSEINVFIDNHAQIGEDLNNLFKRIEDSGIAIVVFSSRYTRSTWCLDELVKIEERARQGLLKVLPIFYNVSPTNVKRLKGEFGDHFRDREHAYKSDEPMIRRWKEAIAYVSNKFGLTFDEKSSVLEIDFVETIIKGVLNMLHS